MFEHLERRGLQIASRPVPAVSFACGKAIIVGEHAVVHGAQAIAMPVKHLGMYLNLVPDFNSEKVRCRLFLGGCDVSDKIGDLVLTAFKILQIEPFALTIKGDSNIPVGAGLGSSATLCVAILRAILASCRRHCNPQSIAKQANLMEERFHGNPSGLDTSVVSHGSCIKFVKGDQPSGLKLSAKVSKWRFALVDSKLRAATRTMIVKAAPFFLGNRGKQRVELFNDLALQAEYGLTQGSSENLANAMNEAGIYLKEAGVVPPALQDIINFCRKLDIPAAKTTGAGGGGTILCLLTQDKADNQIRTLTSVYSKDRVTVTEIG